MANEVEIYIKQDGKASKVVLSGEVFKDIENLSSKLGTKTIIESLIYSAKIISDGIKGVEDGSHEVTLPNGKKAKLTLEKE